MVARWARVLLPIAAWVAIIYLAVTGGSVFAIGALLILGLRLWPDRDPHVTERARMWSSTRRAPTVIQPPLDIETPAAEHTPLPTSRRHASDDAA